MYEWLDREISEINSKKFHVIESQQIGSVIDQLVDIYLSLPPSYIAFLSKFSAVKLYRQLSYYQIGVLNQPKKIIFPSGEKLLHIGHYDDARAYFKYSLLHPGKESPVFEWTEEGFERIADSFEKWLIKRCTDARDSYTDEEWQDIINPKPFTNEEVAIVVARQKFQWRAVGFDEDGNLMIAIRNESKLILPYLSIGIKAKDNTLEGVIWVDVSGINPGQQKVVKHPAYKELIASDNTETYSLPDPLPEDRESYWEFRR